MAQHPGGAIYNRNAGQMGRPSAPMQVQQRPQNYQQQIGRRHGGETGSNSQKPQLVQLVEQLMEKQGVEYYEKNVVNQLIEFMHYYVTETIQDAKQYKDHAGKERIDVGDMRLAIASKNYDSFTRPLPVSTVRQVADDKNKVGLPPIETMKTVSEQQVNQRTQPPNTLPYSQEAHTLMAPNVHVFSEEIKAQVDDKKKKMLRLAIIQMQKSQEQSVDNAKRVAKDDKQKDKRKAKQKENAKKLKGLKNNASINETQQEQDQQGLMTAPDIKNGSGFAKPSLPEGQLPPVLLGKRKADTQIQIEFDPESLKLDKPAAQNDIADADFAIPKSREVNQELIQQPQADPLAENDLFQPISSPNALDPLDAPENNPFMEAEPLDKDGFGQLDDYAGDLDNPFASDDMFMAQPEPIMDSDRDLLQPNLQKSSSLVAGQPQNQQLDRQPGLKNALSELLPSMDLAEPDAEDSDENPFGDDAEMK